MSELKRLGGGNARAVQQMPRFGNGLARQTRREADAIQARAELAAVEEQAHAFLASVAMTNVSVLVNQAETMIRQNPSTAPFLETLVSGYAYGAGHRLNRGL